MAELWALHDCLLHAWNAGFRCVEMETDNKEVAVIILRSSSRLNNSASSLVLSIHELLQWDWDVKLLHISRDRNVVADRMAALGHSLTRDGLMFVVPPATVALMVEEEQAHWDGAGDRERGFPLQSSSLFFLSPPISF
ncbi:hypothetical protein V6N11_004602 [Hibiscus sabdariffa]|uniref:RNase H type-1 domain-containing protein n=1 Tax=Hibiscus sabdariffa TaxID=183260 RepID=A0ABR2SHC3_9ROSI